MKCYILRGAPGSGKSRWVSTQPGPVRIFSADQYFMKDGAYCFDPAGLPAAHDQCLRRFLEAVRPQTNPTPTLIVDNTNTRVWEIAPYYRLAEACGWQVEIVWMIAPLEACLARNTHGVPEEVIRGMIHGAEPLPPRWRAKQIFNP